MDSRFGRALLIVVVYRGPTALLTGVLSAAAFVLIVVVVLDVTSRCHTVARGQQKKNTTLRVDKAGQNDHIRTQFTLSF